MKNHWTDKKALNDFMDLVSEKIAKILNVDPSKIRQVMEEDVRENPLNDEDMRMIRNMEINDEIIDKMAAMIPDDVMSDLLN